jgi:hypothetical protein
MKGQDQQNLMIAGLQGGELTHKFYVKTAVDGVDRVEPWSSSYPCDQPLILESN